MLLHQFYLGCLAHASYLIGDHTSGVAVVVDPQRDVDQYLDMAQREGLEIRHVFLTHFHADFVAGHLELRDRTSTDIRLSAAAQAEYAFVPMADGSELDLGAVRLRVMATPGHTPESISILVYDQAKDPNQPHAVLTGDTLFIGDVGRPDLMASFGTTASELAAQLYDSLHQKLLTLPDETLVYPGHGAGSLCGRNLSTDTVSTIGVQRQYNYALQPMSKEAFIQTITADQPELPEYFAYDAMLNRQEHPTLERSLEQALRPLALTAVLELQRGDAKVLDVREPVDFEGGHVAGAINIGLGGSFAAWAGSVLAPAQAIVIIAEPGRESEAAVRLGRIGFDRVSGYLDGGMAALASHPELVERTERVTAAALAELLAGREPPLVLDVRNEAEWREGHIEGSVNIPLGQLGSRLSDVPQDQHVVTQCAGGYRSAIAASLLQKAGVASVYDLVGGISAWEASRLPVVT